MDLQSYLNDADTIEREGIAAIESAADPAALEDARIAFLGDRQGRVKSLQESLRGVSKEEKPAAGKRFNEVRTRLEEALETRRTTVARSTSSSKGEDLSLPA